MITARNNPFAAHRIDALDYRLDNETWDSLWGRLSGMGFRAAIIGPYGSGKTCLLEGISRRLQSQGRSFLHITLSTDYPSLKIQEWKALCSVRASKAAVLMDGADLLPPWQWAIVKAIVPRDSGLIIAGHKDLGMPLLRRCQTHVGLLQMLLSSLGQEVSDAQACRLFEKHKGNIRDIFRDLYMTVSQNKGYYLPDTISP